MCDLYRKIELLCQRENIKIADLARETEINKTLFSDLKRQKSKSLSLEKLIIIADYFDISLAELHIVDMQEFFAIVCITAIILLLLIRA